MTSLRQTIANYHAALVNQAWEIADWCRAEPTDMEAKALLRAKNAECAAAFAKLMACAE